VPADASSFLTRKLWGVANEPPYFHHGKFTTLREAVLAHGGEAAGVRARFLALLPAEQDAIIKFLKTLQVLPPGTAFPVVDENGLPRLDDPLGFSFP
jgi:cytochrome c peroxidase